MRKLWVVLGLGVATAGAQVWWRYAAPSTTTDPIATADRRSEGSGERGPTLEPAPGAGHTGAAQRTGRCVIAGTVRRAGAGLTATLEVLRINEPPSARNDIGGTTAVLLRMLEGPAGRAQPVPAGASGADGTYRIEGLTPGVYRVTAAAADGARGRGTASLDVDGSRAALDIEVGAAALSLRGRVLYGDGRPFRGYVYVEPADASTWSIPDGTPARIDADGRFTSDGLDAGGVRVVAVEPGRSYVRSEMVRLPREGEFLFVADAERHSHHGRVVADEDGRPVAGAMLLAGASADAGGFALAETTSDADGRFALTLARWGQGGLRAQAPGFAPLRVGLNDLPAPDQEIELRLLRGASLAGLVVAAEDERPIAGVSVRLVHEHDDTRFFPPPPAVTGPDGRYEIQGLLAGSAVAIVEGGGWVSRDLAGEYRLGNDPRQFTLRPGETTRMDFALVRALRAQGRVLDEAGRPVAGAAVHAEGREGPNSYYWRGPLENSRPPGVASGPDGTFGIEGLVGGAYYVFVATTAQGVTAHSALLFADEDRLRFVEIRVVPERRLRVTVQDAASRSPIAGAVVRMEGKDEPVLAGVARSSEETGADGTVVVTTRIAGALTMWVDAEGYRTTYEFPVPVEADAVVVPLDKGYLVAGRVLQPDGAPAAGAEVEVILSASSSQSTSTDRDGSFRFTLDQPGSRLLRARGGTDIAPLTANMLAEAGGEPVSLRLAPAFETRPPPGTLRLRVLDAGGRPVPKALARLQEGTFEVEVHGGWAEFLPPEPGERAVLVWGAAAADGTPLPLGPGRTGALSRDTQEVEVRLPPEAMLDGVVRTAEGRAVGGVDVTALWPPEEQRKEDRAALASTRTDAEGRFHLGHLPAGPCLLALEVPKAFARPPPLRVEGGARDLAIRLDTAVSVDIRVVDADGRAVAGIEVRLDGPAGRAEQRREWGTTDAQGVVRLGHLDPAVTYRLIVRPQAQGSVLPHDEPEWTPANTTVRLNRAFTIRGIVHDPSGRPVPNAMLWVSLEDGIRLQTAKADGTFEIGGLRPGMVGLSAQFEVQHGARGPEVRVAAGSEGVVVIADPGLELVVRIDNWPARKPGPTHAYLQRKGGSEWENLRASIEPGGVATFRGLEAGTQYALWIPPLQGGLSLWKEALQASSDPLHVSLQQGRSITGRLQLPADAEAVEVEAWLGQRNVVAEGIVNRDGSYEIRGLPEGTWTVVARARRGPERLEARADVAAGGTADLVLRPR